MEGYLGEELLFSTENTPYQGYTPSQWALEFISQYGQIDGEHHKLWVLDQVARILLGTPIILKKASWQNGTIEYRFHTASTPSHKFCQWVESMRSDDYTYDEGIAP